MAEADFKLLHSIHSQQAPVRLHWGDDQVVSAYLTKVSPLDNLLQFRVIRQRGELTQEEMSEVQCVSGVGGDQINFRCRKASLIQRDSNLFISADIPEKVARIPNREFFRVGIPPEISVSCRIPGPNGGVQDLPVIDLSEAGAGLLLLMEDPVFRLEAGTLYDKCELRLPDYAPIVCSLLINRMEPADVRDRHYTLGCQFLKVSPVHLNLLRKYIWQIERERSRSEQAINI